MGLLLLKFLFTSPCPPTTCFPIFKHVHEAHRLLVANDLHSLIRSDFCWCKSFEFKQIQLAGAGSTGGVPSLRASATFYFHDVFLNRHQLIAASPVTASKQKERTALMKIVLFPAGLFWCSLSFRWHTTHSPFTDQLMHTACKNLFQEPELNQHWVNEHY